MHDIVRLNTDFHKIIISDIGGCDTVQARSKVYIYRKFIHNMNEEQVI